MIRVAAEQEITIAQRGFTLLELLVVCVLIALMLSVAVPSVRSLYRIDPLTLSARTVEKTVERARSTAIERDEHVLMSINTSTNILAVHSANSPVENRTQNETSETGFKATLPQSVAISSVWTNAMERDKGEPVSVWINEQGMIEPLVVNISAGGRVMSLTFSPFVPVVISDREVVPSARIN